VGRVPVGCIRPAQPLQKSRKMQKLNALAETSLQEAMIVR
jgi:hypothetical protein